SATCWPLSVRSRRACCWGRPAPPPRCCGSWAGPVCCWPSPDSGWDCRVWSTTRSAADPGRELLPAVRDPGEGRADPWEDAPMSLVRTLRILASQRPSLPPRALAAPARVERHRHRHVPVTWIDRQLANT